MAHKRRAHEMEHSTLSRSSFEALVIAADKRQNVSESRIRDVANIAARSYSPEAGICYSPTDTFEAAVEAVVALCGPQSRPPDWFYERASPLTVYKYFVERICEFGDECRQEGRAVEAEVGMPRVPAEHAEAALRLMNQLNEMLMCARPPRPRSPGAP